MIPYHLYAGQRAGVQWPDLPSNMASAALPLTLNPSFSPLATTPYIRPAEACTAYEYIATIRQEISSVSSRNLSVSSTWSHPGLSLNRGGCRSEVRSQDSQTSLCRHCSILCNRDKHSGEDPETPEGGKSTKKQRKMGD